MTMKRIFPELRVLSGDGVKARSPREAVIGPPLPLKARNFHCVLACSSNVRGSQCEGRALARVDVLLRASESD